VDIVSPKEGARVKGREGAQFQGTATNLGGLSLRLFQHADNGLYYLVDNGTVSIVAGRWSELIGYFGAGEEDVGRTFVVIAALSNSSCQSTLRSARPNSEGDIAFTTLPVGCRIADRVGVLKVAP
jgi:hypothetical protein